MAREARIRVLVADDHVMVRAGLKRLIDEQGDMEVISEAADGTEAARLVGACAPDVLLMDVSMPGWGGVAAAQRISAACPEVRIIAVTRHDDEGFVGKMLSAGASGYVLKQSPSAELVQAIRTVAQGRQYVDPGIKRLSQVAAAAGAGVVADTAAEAVIGEPLSATEEDVLRLIASSWSNHRIAGHLKLDAERVAAVRTSAMQKAGLLTRLQVLNYARARGWLKGS